MIIIDFHTHVFPDAIVEKAIATLTANSGGFPPCGDGTQNGLRRSMKAAEIAAAVQLPIATKPSQVATINASCDPQSAPDLIPFGTIHPLTGNIDEEISMLKQKGVRGIKLHPEYQNFHIDDQRVFPIYESLRSAGLIAVVHAGRDPGPFTCDHALPVAMAAVCRNFPGLTIVAAHMGGWQVWKEAEELLTGLPLYFDTSAVNRFLPQADFLRMIRRHGSDRILFGTDWPWYAPREVVRWIDSTGISTAEKEQIFHENAQRLLAA